MRIVDALKDGKGGMLYTFETNREFFIEAVNGFVNEEPSLLRYVRLCFGDFLQGVKHINNVDIAIIDGPEDSHYTLCSTQVIVGLGAKTIIFHDWKESKCREASKWLLDHGTYNLITELDTFTGMALWERI